MRFSCKKCNAKYAIADEKIRGKVVKIRCKHCGQVMIVRGAGRPSVPTAELPKSGLAQSSLPPSALTKSEVPSSGSPGPELSQSLLLQSAVFPSDEPPSNQIDDQSLLPDASLGQDFEQAFKGLYDSGQQQTGSIEKDDKPVGDELAKRETVWYYGLDGTEAGPFTSPEMEERIRVGSITRDHFVWRNGMDDWAPVEKAFGLTAFLQHERPPQHDAAERKIPSEPIDIREPSATDAIVDELSKQAQLAPSSRADWFEEPQFPQLKDKDEDRLQPGGEQQRDRSKEVFTDSPEQKLAEQQLAQAPAPLEDFLAAKIALLGDELAEEPVAAVSSNQELSIGEHELHQASENFFQSGEVLAPTSELLPPLPVVDAEQAAAKLHAESLQEEQTYSVPPVVEAEPPSFDSVIIRQAGVHSTGRRISMALIGVLFVVMVAGGTLALVLRQHWFNNSQLDSIKPDEQTSLVKGERATENNDISSESIRKIRSLLRGEDSQASLGAKPSPELPKPLSTTMRSLILPDNGQNVFDIGAGEDHQRAKSRVQKGDVGVAAAPDITVATDMKLDELRGKKVEAAPLPPDRQIGPEKLTDLQIHLVIQKYYAQVKSCQQRQLQRDSSIVGKMIVVARVQPNGSVEAVRIDTPSFRGSFVEECLIKEIKNWLFPSFKGEAYDVPFQLQLMAREEVSGR